MEQKNGAGDDAGAYVECTARVIQGQHDRPGQRFGHSGLKDGAWSCQDVHGIGQEINAALHE